MRKPGKRDTIENILDDIFDEINKYPDHIPEVKEVLKRMLSKEYNVYFRPERPAGDETISEFSCWVLTRASGMEEIVLVAGEDKRMVSRSRLQAESRLDKILEMKAESEKSRDPITGMRLVTYVAKEEKIYG